MSDASRTPLSFLVDQSLGRLAVGYLAGAWIVVQVLDAVGESWGMTAALIRAIHVALIGGFFVVVSVAWIAGRRSAAAPASVTKGRSRWRTTAIVEGGIALVLLVSLGWTLRSSGQVEWAHTEAIPEAQRLAEAGEVEAAYAMAMQAADLVPDDPFLAGVMEDISDVITVTSEPPGADVYVRPYGGTEDDWELIGQTPIDGYRIVTGAKRWRFEMPGYETVLRAPFNYTALSVRLFENGTSPDGMVRVPPGVARGWTADTGNGLRGVLPPYYYDRYEVTNEAFAAFVEAGGYEDPAYWPELSDASVRAMAMSAFVDATARRGPAFWEVGAPVDGTEGLPVSGVSWHEALAYCLWAEKELPTLLHWSSSSGVFNMGAHVIPVSNFAGEGLIAPGTSTAMGPTGVFDLGGNAREWLWNEAGNGRLTLGGAWNDPDYFLTHAQTFDPMDRSAGNGFRCIREIERGPDHDLARAPVALVSRDYFAESPVEDAVFEVYKRRFDYDPIALDARVEQTGEHESGDRWELVSFEPTYDGSRIQALVIIPPGITGSSQAVVMWPGSTAIQSSSSLDALDALGRLGLSRLGRIFVLPVLRGTFERQDGLESTWPRETNRYADYLVSWVQDLRRTLDYLETREDVDTESVAYLGVSWGGRMGPIALAVEPRFKVGILQSGGLASALSLPEVDPLNYVTRVTQPVLLLNGLRDSVEPYETAQLPLYQLLGIVRVVEQHERRDDRLASGDMPG